MNDTGFHYRWEWRLRVGPDALWPLVAAAEVIATQLFRDLFGDEILRPGEQVSVGSMTILFTDLRDSTRMYREYGDAPAFGLVMDHFDIMRTAVEE